MSFKSLSMKLDLADDGKKMFIMFQSALYNDDQTN